MKERTIWMFIFFVTLSSMILFFTVTHTSSQASDFQELQKIPMNSVIFPIQEDPLVVQEFSSPIEGIVFDSKNFKENNIF